MRHRSDFKNNPVIEGCEIEQGSRAARRSCITTCLLAMVFATLVNTVQADEVAAPVRLRHLAPAPQQLAPAGTLMPLSVQLDNSSDVDMKIRLVGSRDGRFMDIAFPMGVLNASDRPTYTIQIPSPTATMTYQFIIHQRNGTLTLTEKFAVRRKCIQNFKVELAGEQPSAEFKEEMSTLIAKARSLERDTHNLETALKLLDALKKDIPE